MYNILKLGQNNQAGKSILKSDYKDDGTVEGNLKLAVKILLKTMDSTSPSPDRFELSSMKLNQNGKVEHVIIQDDKVYIIYHI